MAVSIIVAVAENWIIGREGKLPWRLSDDMKRFKELTTGHAVVMGRKTYESIGRPLPNRKNVVITRQIGWKAEGCLIAHSLEEALEFAKKESAEEEIFVIGGAEIYKLALIHADTIYLTMVKAVVEGDTSFPALNPSEWEWTDYEPHHAIDEKKQYFFDWWRLKRKPQERREK